MTFEEFFKKKRIDLAALAKSEPALFSEFKTHFEQMGEKSFDHTKKYWFNKTRREFPMAPEIKTEKVHIENPVAEQTVIESLAEPQATPPSAKMGFVPKFKATNMPKPAIAAEEKKEDTPAPPPAKLGFVPKFKAANIPKPTIAAEEKKEDAETPSSEENAAPKPAYKPRFNMKNIPPKPPES